MLYILKKLKPCHIRVKTIVDIKNNSYLYFMTKCTMKFDKFIIDLIAAKS